MSSKPDIKKLDAKGINVRSCDWESMHKNQGLPVVDLPILGLTLKTPEVDITAAFNTQELSSLLEVLTDIWKKFQEFETQTIFAEGEKNENNQSCH